MLELTSFCQYQGSPTRVHQLDGDVVVEEALAALAVAEVGVMAEVVVVEVDVEVDVMAEGAEAARLVVVVAEAAFRQDAAEEDSVEEGVAVNRLWVTHYASSTLERALYPYACSEIIYQYAKVKSVIIAGVNKGA